MSICYYFHPDGYTTAGRQIMGRHVAGESFLRAALKYGSESNLWIQIEKKVQWQTLSIKDGSLEHKAPDHCHTGNSVCFGALLEPVLLMLHFDDMKPDL